MNSFTKRGICKKIIVVLIFLILFNFSIPQHIYASDDNWLGTSLLKEIMQLISLLGDIVMGTFNKLMLGADSVGSAMLDIDNVNIGNPESWLYPKGGGEQVEFGEGEIDERSFFAIGDAFEIPNMLYSPENIFANKIAALDIDFLSDNTSTYTSISGENVKPASASLRQTIANWYKAFRNIAVVGLLSILVYLGIRIMISSTAPDKAKYKEHLRDWFMALCLIFVIHIIMAGILLITNKVTEMFAESTNKPITVSAKDDSNQTIKFNTNLMGLIRFRAQSSEWEEVTAYTIIYLVLVIYTCIFTFAYYRRFLYVAFLTMIAPLVSLTYPIDKAGDGKSQAFDMWFKEYTMNVIIQPVHLILYTVLVGTAYHLATENPIYALVAIGFLIPAEKFVKSMFGLDKGKTASGFGSFAGGAMAMKAVDSLAKIGKGSKGNEGNQGDGSSKEENDKIRTPYNDDAGKLGTYKDNQNKGNQNENERKDDRVNVRDRLEAGEERREGENEERQAGSDVRDREELNAENEGNERLEAGDNIGRENQAAIKDKKVPEVLGDMAITGIRNLGKGVWRNKRKIAKSAARLAGKGVGTVAGGAIGLAGAIATGDPKNLTGALGGAVSGGIIGGKVAGGTAEKVDKGARKFKGAYDEAKYGEKEARRRQERKQFMNNEKEQRKYEKMAAKLGYGGELKDFMGAAADYKEAGVTDEKVIENALKMETDNGKVGTGSMHDQLVDTAAYMKKNDLGKRTFVDDKEYKNFENVVGATGLSEDQQERLKEQTAKLAGQEKVYNYRKNKKNKAEAKPETAEEKRAKLGNDQKAIADHFDKIKKEKEQKEKGNNKKIIL